ncbi:very-long-chain 3-oxoacyl-CoA reductase-like [Daphnia pulicaria]|uniref:very-long-chain 3-oxoacyl-CoA reductase-like n=1 Tax=Daphnia pulicaria TaxID=35523 RepID=UPI001EEBC62A|nr:very-long-chain 3-oxoacyl-CoA reductase-like [Daphnia pulicaria]
MAFVVLVVGWIVLGLLGLKVLYSLFNFIYCVKLSAALGHSLDLRRYGPWAVVTGATDGLGEAYAWKLASLGMNIVLIGRSHSKLQEVAYDIKREHRTIQIRTIAADFTEGESIYPLLKFELVNLPSGVGMLINNVGMDVATSQFDVLSPEEEIQKIINCNIMAMARLTNLLLPGMRSRQRGIIINVGSIWGTGTWCSTDQFEPCSIIYGATKAFVDKFSHDLAVECRQDGIIVQSVMPTVLATKMHGLQDMPSMFVPKPETFVDANFSTLGIESRTAAYWLHKILLYWREVLHFTLPGSIAQWFSRKIYVGIKVQKLWTEKMTTVK